MDIPKVKNILFLCSGGGGNLRFILDSIRSGWLANAAICGVVADRICAATKYASANHIPVHIVDFKEVGQKSLLEIIKKLDPNLIVTTVHKIICFDIVARYEKRMINLHYSILPAFAGAIGSKPVKEAILYGAKFAGVTVHFVNDKLDQGQPLSQCVVAILSDDSVENLMDVIFRVGCISLLNVIKLLLSDEVLCVNGNISIIQIKDRTAFFNPPIEFDSRFIHEDYWKWIKDSEIR